MSEVRDPAIAALLAEARVQFAASMAPKVAELLALVRREAWDDVRRAAHKLRGSTGTYGFAELSAAMAEIEDALLDAGGAPSAPSVESKNRITQRANEAAAEAERATGGNR